MTTDQPHEDNPDSRVLSAAIVKKRDIDLERKRAGDAGRTQRVERSLDSKKFDRLRTAEWKIALAKKMALFAASNDEATREWPYERFEGQLLALDETIPLDMTIQEAVAEVLADLKSADSDWYDRNVAGALEARFAAGKGQASLCAGDTESDSSDSWVRGRSTDALNIDLVTLAVDLQDAADKLVKRASEQEAAATSEPDEAERTRMLYLAKVDRGAASVVSVLIPEDHHEIDLTGLLQVLDDLMGDEEDLQRREEAPEAFTPSTNVVLLDAARDIDAELVDGTGGPAFCTDIAVALRKQALSVNYRGQRDSQAARRVTRKGVEGKGHTI